MRATAGSLRLRRAAAVTAAAGAAAAVTAVALTATAQAARPHGIVIPALHDAASDQPIPYTPACGQAGRSRSASSPPTGATCPT